MMHYEARADENSGRNDRELFALRMFSVQTGLTVYCGDLKKKLYELIRENFPDVSDEAIDIFKNEKCFRRPDGLSFSTAEDSASLGIASDCPCFVFIECEFSAPITMVGLDAYAVMHDELPFEICVAVVEKYGRIEWLNLPKIWRALSCGSGDIIECRKTMKTVDGVCFDEGVRTAIKGMKELA